MVNLLELGCNVYLQELAWNLASTRTGVKCLMNKYLNVMCYLQELR